MGENPVFDGVFSKEIRHRGGWAVKGFLPSWLPPPLVSFPPVRANHILRGPVRVVAGSQQLTERSLRETRFGVRVVDHCPSGQSRHGINLDFGSTAICAVVSLRLIPVSLLVFSR